MHANAMFISLLYILFHNVVEVHRCLVAGPKKFHVFPQSSHRGTTSLPNDGDFQGKLKLFRAGSNKLNQN